MASKQPAGRPAGNSPLLRTEGEALAPGSARALLVTILGELVWPSNAPVWTSTLVSLLSGLGVEAQTARQAINRGAASGWMEPERVGREVQWRLSAKLERIFEQGSQRVFSLSDPGTDWPGTWLSVSVTIPATHRAARRPLYAGLTWAGCGNPMPGLWVTPHTERADEVRRVIADLDLAEHTVAWVGTVDPMGIREADLVSRGWDLQGLAEHYQRILGVIEGWDPEPGDPMLHAFLRLISEWQELPRTDPQLPQALLPDWIGRTVARRIEVLRERWTPQVRARYAELNAG